MLKIKQTLQGGGIQALSLPETFIRAFNELYSRQCLSSPGLAVNATNTLFQVTNLTPVVDRGVLSVIPAVTAFPALTGYTLTATQIGGFVATVDGSGVLRALPINPSISLTANVGFPEVPVDQVPVGVVLINAVNPAIFTGGTSVMSGTNVTYVNIVGPFNPTNIV